MKYKKPLFALCAFFLLASVEVRAQVLDDVRQDIIKDSRDDIKAINEEILRQKRLKAAKREAKKSAYREKIDRVQRLKAIKMQREIIFESEELLKDIKERTKFVSEKRWRYEEMIKIYAEKPLDETSVEEQEDTANQFLASATTELVELLKIKAIQESKKKRGEEYEEIVASPEMLVQLNQYTQLVKSMESYKGVQQEKIVMKQESIVRSTKELIELLKQEAIRRAEVKVLAKEEAVKQIMQLKQFEGTVGLHYGYDNNINADDAFEGALFLRNYFALSWIPSINQYLKADIGAWYLADNHADDQDVTLRIAAGQTSLKWYPLGNEKLLIQLGYEWSDTHYPNDASLATKENNLFVNVKHKFWDKWSQELNYDDYWINSNNNRLARGGGGNDLTDVALEKRKHTLEYVLGVPFFYETRLKFKQQGTIQTSNDAYLEYYDYNSYKTTAEIGRSITEKLYAKATFSYEQKDYTERTVSAHQVAQEDKTYSQKVSLFYFLNKDWLINYTFSNAKIDSNSSVYDYEKKTHLLGVYYSF